jgi:hypothetical protein
MLFKLQQRVNMLYIINNLIEGYMMFNEDIRSVWSFHEIVHSFLTSFILFIFWFISFNDFYFFISFCFYVFVFFVCCNWLVHKWLGV